jgi:ABC-type sugar transport system ATPase subunit
LQVPLPVSGAAHSLERVTVGIRPEGADAVGAGAAGAGGARAVGADATGRDDRMRVQVARVERLGSEIFAFVDPVGLVPGATGRSDHLVFRLDKRQDLQEGSELALRVHLDEVLVFDADGHALR